MNLSSESMLVLMAYADGELEGDERTQAERLLATEPEATRFVEQLGGLGDLLQLGHEGRHAARIAKLDITDAVMSRAASAEVEPAEAEARKRGAPVTSLAAAREKRAGAQPSGSRLKIGAGIVAALALAASFAVFAQHRTEEAPMVRATSAPATPPSPTAAAQPEVAANVAGTGVEVSTVNSPGNAVSVFYLPSANELSTSVVVWVDETGEK